MILCSPSALQDKGRKALFMESCSQGKPGFFFSPIWVKPRLDVPESRCLSSCCRCPTQRWAAFAGRSSCSVSSTPLGKSPFVSTPIVAWVLCSGVFAGTTGGGEKGKDELLAGYKWEMAVCLLICYKLPADMLTLPKWLIYSKERIYLWTANNMFPFPAD